jgi:hypothetical protein
MLNISEKYQFLFIHIPKCAGTSIESFFGYDYDNKLCFEHNFNNIGHPKHLTLNNYEKILNEESIKKIFKFTIIRNPFDRIVSAYNYSLYSDKIYWNGRNDYDYKKSLLSFENFIKQFKIKIPNSFDHFIETKENKMDYIIRFENINDNFKELCNILNIKDKNLPFENKTPNRKNYRDYYDNKTKDIIYSIFEKDLKKYNYDF